MLKGGGSSHHRNIKSRNRSISESQSASHSYNAGTSKNDDSNRVRRMSGGNGIRKR